MAEAVPAVAMAGAAAPVATTGTAVPVVVIGKAGTKEAAIGAAGMPEVRPVTAVLPVPIWMTDRTCRSNPVVAGTD